MIGSGLLILCCCCALRLEGKNQIEIIPVCASSEGRVTPCCIIVAHLPISACVSRHAPNVPCWIAFIISSLAVPIKIHFIYNGMTAV